MHLTFPVCHYHLRSKQRQGGVAKARKVISGCQGSSGAVCVYSLRQQQRQAGLGSSQVAPAPQVRYWLVPHYTKESSGLEK